MEIKNVEREDQNLNLMNEKLKIELAAMKTVLQTPSMEQFVNSL